jgi:hypothetical protein
MLHIHYVSVYSIAVINGAEQMLISNHIHTKFIMEFERTTIDMKPATIEVCDDNGKKMKFMCILKRKSQCIQLTTIKVNNRFLDNGCILAMSIKARARRLATLTLTKPLEVEGSLIVALQLKASFEKHIRCLKSSFSQKSFLLKLFSFFSPI